MAPIVLRSGISSSAIAFHFNPLISGAEWEASLCASVKNRQPGSRIVGADFLVGAKLIYFSSARAESLHDKVGQL